MKPSVTEGIKMRPKSKWKKHPP